MKSKVIVILQILLWLIFAFHVVIGVGLNVSPGFPQLVADYYGAQVTFNPTLLYIVKPVGAFMIVVGFMAAAAARDPLRQRAIVYGLVLLFAIRGLQRFVFQDEISTVVGIAAARNIGNGIFFLLLGAAVLVLLSIAVRQTEAKV